MFWRPVPSFEPTPEAMATAVEMAASNARRCPAPRRLDGSALMVA